MPLSVFHQAGTPKRFDVLLFYWLCGGTMNLFGFILNGDSDLLRISIQCG